MRTPEEIAQAQADIAEAREAYEAAVAAYEATVALGPEIERLTEALRAARVHLAAWLASRG